MAARGPDVVISPSHGAGASVNAPNTASSATRKSLVENISAVQFGDSVPTRAPDCVPAEFLAALVRFERAPIRGQSAVD